MKKYFSLFVLFLSFVSITYGQTTATNFNVADCNGQQHDLFTELDAGKVVILVWVMPCGSCIGPALTAYNIAQTYSASYPGKIQYFLCDDYANTSCSALNSWADQNGIGTNRYVFSNSAIDMMDYGSAGMPKVVILGGSNHHIFFNANNTAAGNATNIQNALDQAILSSGIVEQNQNELNISLAPNPASYELTVSLRLNQVSDVEFQILNINGALAKSYDLIKSQSGEVKYNLKVNNLAKGNYILKTHANDKIYFNRFSVVY